MMCERLDRAFYRQDVLEVAPALLGKDLVVVSGGGQVSRHTITETEAYRGGEDLACHASKGMTERTRVMFGDGGMVYMYLIYGMYWMFNVVSSGEGRPQAVLLRGIHEANGPGRLTRLLGLDGHYYGEDLVASERIWIEDNSIEVKYSTAPRIGVDYAGEPWKEKPWRFILHL